MKEVTPDLIKEIRNRFGYLDGRLFIKYSGQWKGTVGADPGTERKDGRKIIQIKNKRFFYHQIVWLLHNEALPESIDHIDRNPKNNRIENLRPATQSQQNVNRDCISTNTSGFRGVSFRKGIKDKKWRASCNINGKVVHIGYFRTSEEAAIAYDAKVKEHYGDFANPNFK